MWLADQRRTPLHRPSKVSDEAIKLILASLQRWKWGPRKLRIKLAQEHPRIALPAQSHATLPAQQPFGDVNKANETWCVDFKGYFRTGGGSRCAPLTITDAWRRMRLGCQIVAKTDTVHVEAFFDHLFFEYGLPAGQRAA